MTVLEVLQSSTDYFKRRKIDNARLNAEHLLAHVLGRKRIELYLEFERDLTEPELVPLRELVRRRIDRRRIDLERPVRQPRRITRIRLSVSAEHRRQIGQRRAVLIDLRVLLGGRVCNPVGAGK